MIAESQKKYTLEEYFALELASDEKFEYWDGHVWSMSGASISHNRIVRNLLTALDTKFRQTGCETFPSDTRIDVPIYPPYRYPDLTALCGKPKVNKTEGLEILMNPQLIVEVLSDSTEKFDRGDKFYYYKSIASFTEYLLISQKRPHITQFIKQNETDWLNRDFIGLETVFRLGFAPIELALSEIYRDVEFNEEDLL
jgi:Uma2 family endonuclease